MKPHYPILDGLRGTAAILVVIFHLLEAYFLDPTTHPMQHGYLAVDFFYLLSGFVVGYAYDDRWATMGVKDFLKIRLVRLHPLVVWSVAIGALAFWFNPYAAADQMIGFWTLLGITLIGFTLLPTPDVRGWGETHSLNGPCWSLVQEYIANILYAFIGRKLNKTALLAVVLLSAILLIAVAGFKGTIGTGWSFKTFWIAPVRMLFPFFAGLLLFRTGKMVRIPMAYPLCSLLLICIFFLPAFAYNGLFEAGCIILVFPLVVAAGAGGQISGRWAKLCHFSGAISYPLYIIHYPFIYIFAKWMEVKQPTGTQMVVVGCGLFVFFILLAWASLKLYDEPVRNWLKRRFLTRASA